MEILRRIWTSDKPFDHDGKYYKFERGFAEVKPLQQPHIPIYFGGASEAALEIAGRHADVYALWGEPMAEAAEDDRAGAGVGGEAWAHGALQLVDPADPRGHRSSGVGARAGDHRADPRNPRPWNAGRADQDASGEGLARLLAAAANGGSSTRGCGPRSRRRSAAGNTTALVGTPEQVAESMLAYYALGVTTFLIRGFDPLEDATDYGRELIPIVRREIARREERGHVAAQAAG